jgi:3-hydroxyacyl-CoA dehydrogenase/enoyl-CoA hydratase/carnithine racemase
MAEELVTQFKVTYADSRAGRMAVVTMDNGEDYKKPNTFGAGALRSLSAALDEIEGQGDVKGLLLTGKQFIFAVGADLTAFSSVGGPDEARAGGKAGQDAFRRIAELPFPTVAAINGACMGGGLEIALHCDVRTLSTAAAAIAFPEVFLSILPGWGGTQAAPRLIGGPKALEVIVHNALSNNKVLKPQEAFELGLADRLIPSVTFFEDSFALLERIALGEEAVEREQPSTDGLDEALERARRFADDKVHGATRAPYLAIDCIEHAARGGDVDAGYAKEADALAELLPARQAQAAVYAFTLTQQRVKKQPWKPEAQPRQVRKIAIIGAGLMGAQLGALHLQRFEVPLVMKDIDEGVLARARETIEGELDKRVQKGRLKEGKAAFLKGLVTYTTEYEPVAGSDFVLEAVVEVLELKKRIFADVEAVVDDGCILATNTSSLSVEAMAADLAHPERVVGFHFFNPVAVMPLLEVVKPEGASDEAMATAFSVAKTLKKSAVQCADTPAFIVNRLLSRFNGACTAALEHGNGFAEIDDAVKELGLPMGPFELIGFVGLKVAYHTTETLHEAYPERFPLSENFARIVEADVPGIYDWSKGRVPYDEVAQAVEVAEGKERLTGDEIRSMALEAVADEIGHMLDEGVVADARDIDTCMLLGAGWPFFMGGICMYLDQTGLSEKHLGRQLVTDTDRAFA